jgi:hypothetical protein
MEKFQEKEAEIARRTILENAVEAELCDAIFGPFEKGFEALQPAIKVEKVRIETTQLLALAFNALRWSQQQLVTGYYAPAVTMARSVWESWLNGEYLNRYPERLEEWKRNETRPRPFQMRQLVAAKMEPDDDAERGELLQAMNALYQGKEGHRFSGFSALSHPSWEAIRILVGDDDDGLTLRVGPAYDQGLFRMALDLYCTAGLFSGGLFGYVLEGSAMESVGSELASVDEQVRLWRASVKEP